MIRKGAWTAYLVVAATGCTDRIGVDPDPSVRIQLPDASANSPPTAVIQPPVADDGRRMWSLTPQPLPSAGWPRDQMPRPAVVFDDVRQRVVVFPGASSERPPVLPYTVWEWDGAAWEDRTPADPATPPSPLWMQGAAFDRARGVAVLFGGAEHPQVDLVAETWEWDGAALAQRSPAVSPPARAHQAMAYDPDRSVTVLFGGLGRGWVFGDLWEWDGVTWTERTPDPGAAAWPAARYGASMVWDDRRHRMLMFGGQGSEVLAELWAWDGASWTNLTPSPLPAAWPHKRQTHVAAFDRTRGAMLLFGGATADGPSVLGYLRDLWEWDADAEAFHDLTPADAAGAPPAVWPLPTDEAGAAFDCVRRRLVIFGGETKADGAIALGAPSALYEYGR